MCGCGGGYGEGQIRYIIIHFAIPNLLCSIDDEKRAKSLSVPNDGHGLGLRHSQ